jgi:hypothetical protein
VRADTTRALFGAVPIVHAAPAERGEAKDGADGNEEGGTVGPAAMCVPLYGGRVQDHSTLRSPGGIGLSARCHAGVALLPDSRGGSCAKAEHNR